MYIFTLTITITKPSPSMTNQAISSTTWSQALDHYGRAHPSGSGWGYQRWKSVVRSCRKPWLSQIFPRNLWLRGPFLMISSWNMDENGAWSKFWAADLVRFTGIAEWGRESTNSWHSWIQLARWLLFICAVHASRLFLGGSPLKTTCVCFQYFIVRLRWAPSHNCTVGPTKSTIMRQRASCSAHKHLKETPGGSRPLSLANVYACLDWCGFIHF